MADEINKVETESVSPYDRLMADLSAEDNVQPEAEVQTEAEVENTPSEQQEIVVEEAESLPVPELKKEENSTDDVLVDEVTKDAIAAENQPSEVAEEELPDFNSEEFMDQFYDDPAKAVEKAANVIAERKVKEVVAGIEKRLKPLLDQSEEAQLKDEVKSVIGNFINENSDAKDMFPEMAEYIKSNNLDPRDKRSYMDAYRESKIGRQNREIENLRASQGKNLSDYLSDESSLGEIANNEAVKQKVIEEYLRGLQNGSKPATIGNNGTNAPSAQSVNNPKTIKEAGALLREQLSK